MGFRLWGFGLEFGVWGLGFRAVECLGLKAAQELKAESRGVGAQRVIFLRGIGIQDLKL